MNKRRAAAVLLALLALAAAAVFVFGNSLDHAAESTAKSDAVTDLLFPLLSRAADLFTGKTLSRADAVRFVRKGAHFAEFFLVGGIMAYLTLILPGGMRWERIFLPLFGALAAAVCDEFIQTFLDRSGQVRDVVLDFAGAVCGIGLVFLLASAAGKRRKNQLGSRPGRKDTE